jgi:hypothetical protein
VKQAAGAVPGCFHGSLPVEAPQPRCAAFYAAGGSPSPADGDAVPVHGPAASDAGACEPVLLSGTGRFVRDPPGPASSAGVLQPVPWPASAARLHVLLVASRLPDLLAATHVGIPAGSCRWAAVAARDGIATSCTCGCAFG